MRHHVAFSPVRKATTSSFGRILTVSLVSLTISGCARKASSPCGFGTLSEYVAYNDSARQIFPQEYIDQLKQTVFQHGELDHLPDSAIIVHYADTEKFLSSAGYQSDEWTTLLTGTTDPNVLYVVHPEKGRSFIVNSRLAGRGRHRHANGGAWSFGVRKVVHIGTSCLLGNGIANSNLVVSLGSYKDGAAVLLSDYDGRHVGPIAKPDANLVRAIESALKHENIAFQESIGYTIPVFYFQPSGLMRALLDTKECANVLRPGYIEMEEAPFFQTCKRMHIESASIIIGSDRYVLSNNEPKHEWLGDTGEAIKLAFKSAIEAMEVTH